MGSIVPGMEAEKAGLKRGDILVSANGQPLRSISKLPEIEKATDGKPVELVYSRAGQEHSVIVTPVKSDLDDQGSPHWMIGLTAEPRIEITKLPFFAALRESAAGTCKTRSCFQFLEGMLERRMSPKSIVGPVKIAAMSGDAARAGAASFFSLMAAVSLNLAIFNLLPIPILDGGVIMMLLIEMLLRRELDLKVKEAVVKVGFVFLMVVVVFVIYNDISKILPG